MLMKTHGDSFEGRVVERPDETPLPLGVSVQATVNKMMVSTKI